MKYLDKVELINDKPYVDEGLKTRRVGRIISPEIRDNEFYVNFIDENFYIHTHDKIWFENHMEELQDDISLPFGVSLLGKPVFVSDNMPEMEAGNTAIYYGNMTGLATKFTENMEIAMHNTNINIVILLTFPLISFFPPFCAYYTNRIFYNYFN